jgi:CSLREA domain-containing protein
MRGRSAGLWLGCLITLGTLVGTRSSTAQAAEFTVDVTADSDDSTPGDGVCRASSGLCTLRAAVQEANALAGDDVIKLRSGTYILQDDPTSGPRTRGDLDVTENLTIQPLSGTPVIDGKALSRIFEVTRSAPDVDVTLVLIDLTLNAGNAGSEFAGEPACGLDGGAVCAIDANVRLQNCTVKGHRAENGGALFVNGGALTILGSDLTGNTATSLGGAVAAQSAVLEVGQSTIADNKIDAGGSFGGGMAVYDATSLQMVNSTFSGNVAVGSGGGLEITAAGDVAIRNCTFSANTATGGSGGAIDFRSATSFLLSNVTIARNSGGGLMLETATGATVRNSLLVLNLPQDCTGTAEVSANNLLSTADNCGLTGPAPTTDPKLATTLDANGTRNESKTLALLEDSPADNQGSACEATDQRGFTRAAACDIGAYERLDDEDGDFVPEDQDNCPGLSNADQVDFDADGIGDVCDCLPKSATVGTPDQDDDLDGILNRIDCCPDTPTLAQTVTCLEGGVAADSRGCAVSQACDCNSRIIDGKAYPWGKRKGWKQCVRKTVAQIDGINKRCKRDVRRAIIGDPNLSSCGKYVVPPGTKDTDGDGIIDASDNCRHVYNPLQTNSDDDTEKKTRGDACDDDDDNDNLKDAEDKCPTVISCKNEDADSDGVGNECDECPWESTGAPIDVDGCEQGQEGKGSVEPPTDCKVVDAPADDDGEIIDE